MVTLGLHEAAAQDQSEVVVLETRSVLISRVICGHAIIESITGDRMNVLVLIQGRHSQLLAENLLLHLQRRQTAKVWLLGS
jgi:hypothetical protein